MPPLANDRVAVGSGPDGVGRGGCAEVRRANPGMPCCRAFSTSLPRAVPVVLTLKVQSRSRKSARVRPTMGCRFFASWAGFCCRPHPKTPLRHLHHETIRLVRRRRHLRRLSCLLHHDRRAS